MQMKTAIRILALGAAAALLVAGAAVADPIGYTVQSDGDDMLYSMDLMTAAATAIGATGHPDVEGLAFHPSTGVLYGWDDGEKSSDALLTLDLTTGAATVVGSPTSCQPGFNVGIAFCPDGTLYLVSENDQAVRGDVVDACAPGLYTVDLASGELTSVGSFAPASNINAIACSSSGVIYGVDDFQELERGLTSTLWTLDRSTGAATMVGATGIQWDDGEIAFDGDTLWGIEDDANTVTRTEDEETDGRGIQPSNGAIYTFDLGTGTATEVALTTPGGFESLTIESRPSVLEIPTASGVGLGVLALGLLAAGALLLRRRTA